MSGNLVGSTLTNSTVANLGHLKKVPSFTIPPLQSESVSLFRFILTCAITLTFLGTTASADLYQIRIQTIQWLVDQSDVIAIVQIAEDGRLRKTLKVLKGDIQDVSFPLKPIAHNGYQYFQQPMIGLIRLSFIRDKNQLIHQIDLSRKPIENNPSLSRDTYGFSQFGDILLTQRDLFQSIFQRVNSGPSIPVKHNQRRTLAVSSGVAASPTFPLESDDQTYVLVVPFTIEFRNHYLRQLKTGTASEQVDAIRTLSYLDDSTAWQAIRNATTATNIVPDFRVFPGAMVQTNTSDVQNAVTEALRWSK